MHIAATKQGREPCHYLKVNAVISKEARVTPIKLKSLHIKNLCSAQPLCVGTMETS